MMIQNLQSNKETLFSSDGSFHRVFNESNEILEFAAIFNGESILKISQISKLFISKYFLIAFPTLLFFNLYFCKLSHMLFNMHHCYRYWYEDFRRGVMQLTQP